MGTVSVSEAEKTRIGKLIDADEEEGESYRVWVYDPVNVFNRPCVYTYGVSELSTIRNSNIIDVNNEPYGC